MMASSRLAAPVARERKVVLLVVDLAGFTRAVAGLETEAVVALLEVFFAEAGAVVREGGGRVVKYLGDGCLAVFDGDCAPDAVSCALAIEEVVRSVADRFNVDVELGANVHRATVHEGEFGPDDDRRYDVVGWGVMHAFRMGGGPGVRVSEPVYRSIPSAQRSVWRKHQPPATYSLER